LREQPARRWSSTTREHISTFAADAPIFPLPRHRDCTDNIRTMNILIFGATGMVGQGVLRECLLDPNVQTVATIGRSAAGQQNPKLREIVHKDLSHYAPIAEKLSGFDACFFCLGIGSAGMTEQDYERVTYGFTIAAAEPLSHLNPNMVFIYVSGTGTDSSEKGRMMWARVKGKTENALLRMPFAAAYMFRPGFIEPAHGETSRTKLYRISYAIAKPFLPLIRALFRNQILTTEQIARAMLTLVTRPYPKHILEIPDIHAAAEVPPRQRNEVA
jgi:uncharacterized protein YbjT (DUF2867 family)